MSNNELKIVHDLAAEVRRLREKIELLTDGGRMRQKFWTAEQTMEFLSISRNTLYKHAKELGGHKMGRQWRFKPENVENSRLRGEL